MVLEVNRQCQLERSERKFQRSSTRYTEAQRLELARDFLQTHDEMALWQYCGITGLLKIRPVASCADGRPTLQRVSAERGMVSQSGGSLNLPHCLERQPEDECGRHAQRQ